MPAKPLVVDLDGTLFMEDSAWENLRALLLHQPASLGGLLLSAIRGRAAVKCWLHREVGVRRGGPPFRSEIQKVIQREKKRGRAIHLISGAPQDLVNATARRLGLSRRGDHWGTTPADNLTTRKKNLLLKKFGLRGYDYFGDREVDLPIFQAAFGGAVVGARPGLVRRALRINPRLEVLSPLPSLWRSAWKGLRPHQWVKNLLLLVPLFSAHAWDQAVKWPLAIGAIACFNFLSSAVYLLNDIHDLEADRIHPIKRNRPLAGGTLKLAETLGLAAFFLGVALTGAWFLGPTFFLCAAIYVVLALVYNSWAKRRAGLDLIGLAGFYTLRIFAGGAAVGIACSPWLIGFAIFIFLSLACVKRVSELLRLKGEKRMEAIGRGYGVRDEDAISMIGIASGVVSVLVAALYVNSSDVSILYVQPQILWLLCPILFYWVIRVWLKTLRGQMPEDPILFALKDPVSWLLLGLALLTGVTASR